jgi:hypothetical protein
MVFYFMGKRHSVMKYSLSTIKYNNNTHLSLENVIPARTGHIRGYGSGVTFTSKGTQWSQSASITSVKMLQFSNPTVITQ